MKMYLHDYIYNYRCSKNNVFHVIVDLEVGERTEPKTLKDLRFSESPLEIPAYHEESGSRPRPHQSQVTSKETL